MSDKTKPEQVPELVAITVGVLAHLKERFPQLTVHRNGTLQITLFNPLNFLHAQIVVSSDALYVVENPTKDKAVTLDKPVKPGFVAVGNNIKGPFSFEDPNLVQHVEHTVDLWLKRQRA